MYATAAFLFARIKNDEIPVLLDYTVRLYNYSFNILLAVDGIRRRTQPENV